LGIEELFLTGFKEKSTQGDSIISEWMNDWNVETTFTDEGISLKRTNHFQPKEIYDFINCPDLAQTIITLAALKKYPLKFTGIESLAHKETDRIVALQNELSKLEAGSLREEAGSGMLEAGHWTLDVGRWTLDSNNEKKETISIDTYHDHRMAMAFSMLSMVFDEVNIENEQVVSKSYPTFWKDFEKMGFMLSDL
jgi:3-phosphoshikimate 1-carboxyvinyltransferase